MKPRRTKDQGRALERGTPRKVYIMHIMSYCVPKINLRHGLGSLEMLKYECPRIAKEISPKEKM